MDVVVQLSVGRARTPYSQGPGCGCPFLAYAVGGNARANALIVTANLKTHLMAAGYGVTTNIGVPAGSLATYQQIWDVRFNVALTASDSNA
jgi:hypothetical protein